MNAQNICDDLFNIATDIHNELGGGFNEAVHQNALAIEFRDNGIKYIKEVNIDIFIKVNQLEPTDLILFYSLREKRAGNSMSRLLLKQK